MIWDCARAIWIVLTPEEWVRQHTLHFLCHNLNIPLPLITVEHPAQVGTNTNQRIDILTYNKQMQAQILVECKAANVKISSEVLDQAVRYNSDVKAQFIMLTNGLTHFFYRREPSGGYSAVEEFPVFSL